MLRLDLLFRQGSQGNRSGEVPGDVGNRDMGAWKRAKRQQLQVSKLQKLGGDRCGKELEKAGGDMIEQIYFCWGAEHKYITKRGVLIP